jgi:hypothetical protein
MTSPHNINIDTNDQNEFDATKDFSNVCPPTTLGRNAVVSSATDYVWCSYKNCNTRYSIYKFPECTPLRAPMNEDEKFWALLESINQTKLFCMQHSIQHATMICTNSGIPYDE